MSSSVPYPRRQQKQRKVLLMGKSGAGKSSMRSIVFSNYVARDVRRLGATIDIEHSHIKFMGNLMLNLWDCGGQDGFLDNYIHRQRSHVFDSVTVLIFVFDINSFDERIDLENYRNINHALGEYSPSAKIFILIHKMDLVPIPKRESQYASLVQEIRKETLPSFQASLMSFGTSIWDQTLYKAWTAIIYSLIPNVSEIETKLRALATAINARELILYERTTCLMVTHVTQGIEQNNPFLDRFERISSILKTHNLSLLRHQNGGGPDSLLSGGGGLVGGSSDLGGPVGGASGGASGPGGNTNLGELHIKTGRFSFFITRLTENANLAATIPSSEQAFNIARASIMEAQPRFAQLDFGGHVPSSSAAAAAASAAAAAATHSSTAAAHAPLVSSGGGGMAAAAATLMISSGGPFGAATGAADLSPSGQPPSVSSRTSGGRHSSGTGQHPHGSGSGAGGGGGYPGQAGGGARSKARQSRVSERRQRAAGDRANEEK